MRNSIIAAGVFALAFVWGTAAHAAGPKIGVVDIQAVIAQSNAGQAAKQRLDSLVSEKKTEINQRKQKVLALKDKLDSMDKKASDQERQKILNEYQKSFNDYQQDISANQQDMEAQREALLKPIQQRLVKVLNEYARDHHYDIILNKDVGGALFASDAYDITTEVTEAMDAMEKSEKAAAKGGKP